MTVRQEIGQLMDHLLPRSGERMTDDAFCELQDSLVALFEASLREIASSQTKN
jgi:hypothetical protein